MKRVRYIFILCAGLASCNAQPDYKASRDEVIKVHDVVMADQGKVVDQQLQLESLLKDMTAVKQKFPALDTLKEKDSITVLHKDLNLAEEAMNTWMHEFEPDVTGKSNEEAIAYFEAEKQKIKKVDTLFKAELKRAAAYLSKFEK